MSNKEKNIKFVYIGNIRTSKKTGEYPNENDPSVYEGISKIYERASVLSNNSEVVKFGNSKDQDTYILLNPTNNTLFYAITTTNFKKEFVVDLFQEMEKQSLHLLVDTEGRLNDVGKKSLKNLVDSYQGKTSLIQDLNSDIDQVKIELRENINKQIASNEKSEELNDKASKLKDSANMFKGNANNLQKKTWWQNLKWTLIIVTLVLAVLLIIIVPIIVSSSSSSSDSNTNDSNANAKDPNANANEENSSKKIMRFLVDKVFS